MDIIPEDASLPATATSNRKPWPNTEDIDNDFTKLVEEEEFSDEEDGPMRAEDLLIYELEKMEAVEKYS